MANAFFWYDVMTTDTRAAQKFYCDVVGWKLMNPGRPGEDYRVLSTNGHGVAGVMPFPADARATDVHPVWMGYIAVDDVDATAEKVRQEGGTVHRPPSEVPGVIRYSVVADPQGSGFLIAKGLVEGPPPPLPTGTAGTIGWRELYASEWRSAFAFYEKLFGWTRAEAIDMGSLGMYQLFAAGAEPVGGMMTKPPEMRAGGWGYYINVPSIDAAGERVRAGGGKIIHGPEQVPGGQWTAQALDPQGAAFGMVAKER